MRYVLMIGFIFFVIFLVLTAIILGSGIGVGWLLTLFLPFTLFEGAVLGVLATSIAGATTWRLFKSGPGYADDESLFDDEDFDLDDLPLDVIHPSRFVEDEEDRTWENWFHYLFANDIYRDLSMFGEQVTHMNDMQKQELAIRLAEVIVAILKAKPPSTRRIRITKEQIRRKMVKMGMRPYDDDIIELALDAVEDNLDIFDEQLVQIIRTRSWDAPSKGLF